MAKEPSSYTSALTNITHAVCSAPYPQPPSPRLQFLSVKLHAQDVLANLNRTRLSVKVGFTPEDTNLCLKHAKTMVKRTKKLVTKSLAADPIPYSAEVSVAYTSLIALDLECSLSTVEADFDKVRAWLDSVSHLNITSDMALFVAS